MAPPNPTEHLQNKLAPSFTQMPPFLQGFGRQDGTDSVQARNGRSQVRRNKKITYLYKRLDRASLFGKLVETVAIL